MSRIENKTTTHQTQRSLGVEAETNRPIRFVVVRDGYRVSAEEYENPDDPRAIAEANWWTRLANRHSWGERVEIVEYNNKYHRVY